MLSSFVLGRSTLATLVFISIRNFLSSAGVKGRLVWRIDEHYI